MLVTLLLYCVLLPCLYSHLLFDLDLYIENNPAGMFPPLFYKQVARELAHKLAVIFRHLVREGSFPVCWRWARCCPSAKGICFLGCWGLQGIYITPFLSKVFEKIVAGKLAHFLESNSMLLPSQFSYRRGLGTCDALRILPHHLEVALDRDMEGRFFQLDFSVAFGVSHSGLLYKLRSIGVGGQFQLVLSNFLSDRRQRVRLNKVSESVKVISGVPQCSVLGLLLFIL